MVEQATHSPPMSPSTTARSVSAIKANLFGSVKDTLVTVIMAAVLGLFAYSTIKFLLGADFTIVKVNLRLMLVGDYPRDELLRVSIFLLVTSLCSGLFAGIVHGRQVKLAKASTVPIQNLLKGYVQRFWIAGALVLLLLSMTETLSPWLLALGCLTAVLVGRFIGQSLPLVALVPVIIAPFLVLLYVAQPLDSVDDFGGFFTNIVVSIISIALCFPLGVVIALGRRSKMKVISWLSVVYIEILRGGPLFVWLFLAGVLVGFVMPGTFSPPSILRAVVVFTLFTSAYMAEIIRGGLQAIPKGQVEAGQALGLSPIKQLRLIVLPQALRNVIPAQISQLISLIKDTTLAGIALGLFEVLATSGASTSQEAFRSEFLLFEVLGFVALLFWVVCYTVSRESQRFERKLQVTN